MGDLGASFWLPLIIGASTGTASALFAPDGQDISSFEGIDGIDPIEGMRDSRTMITELGQVLSGRAQEPFDLRSSYVQSLPTFSGGGLPMPIGVTGRDPALSNPYLLGTRQPPVPDGEHRVVSPPDPTRGFPRDGFWANPEDAPDTSRPNLPRPVPVSNRSNGFHRPRPTEPRTPTGGTSQPRTLTGMTGLAGPAMTPSAQAGGSGVRRRPRPTQGMDLMTDPGDDSQQAIAAVKLLMSGVGGGA